MISDCEIRIECYLPFEGVELLIYLLDRRRVLLVAGRDARSSAAALTSPLADMVGRFQ